VLRLRTLVALLVGPALALLVPDAVIRSSPGYWRLMAGWETGTTSAVEAAVRLRAPGSVDLVVLGNSLALSDLDEGRLADLLGTPAGGVLNLGVKTATAAEVAMLLPQVLELEPRAAVLVVHSGMLADRRPGPAAGGRLQGVPEPTLYDPGVALRIYPPRALWEDRGEHLRGALGAGNVFLRHRRDLRYLLTRLLLHGGRPPPFAHPRDFTRLPPPRLERALVRARSWPLSFSADGTPASAVRVLAAGLERHGVALTVAPAPDHPAVRGTAYHPGYVAFVRRLAREVGFSLVDPAAFPAFTDRDFVDEFHMTASGREAFTATVARHLAASAVGSGATP